MDIINTDIYMYRSRKVLGKRHTDELVPLDHADPTTIIITIVIFSFSSSCRSWIAFNRANA